MTFSFIAKNRGIWPVALVCEALGVSHSGFYKSVPCQNLTIEHSVECGLSRSGNVWDNAAMESLFSMHRTERTAHKYCRTRDEARADVFDYIERFYNPRGRHSTLGDISPVAYEAKMLLA